MERHSTDSRSRAWQAFTEFLPDAGVNYSQRRNFDLSAGGVDTTSRLSAAISRRLMSEDEILHRCVEAHGADACFKFAQQTVWRTYWKGWLEWHPSVWSDYRVALDTLGGLPVSQMHRKALEAATGIEAFDHWRRSLAASGWLHNHARLWFASIWIFTLRLPWQLGAKLFLDELVDADAAANTLSWRWVAGLHTAGKMYVARAENIQKFTDGRFFPAGQLDEGPAGMVESSAAMRLSALPESSLVELPHGKRGLLIHREDLSVETTQIGTGTFDRVAFLRTPSASQSACVKAFETAAEMDAVERLRRHFEVDVTYIASPEQLNHWTRGLDAVVVMDIWQGTLRDAVLPWFTDVACPVLLARREYDLRLIPHATSGFFSFSRDLPSMLKGFVGSTPDRSVRFRNYSGTESVDCS